MAKSIKCVHKCSECVCDSTNIRGVKVRNLNGWKSIFRQYWRISCRNCCSELGCNSVNWIQWTTVPNYRQGGMKPISKCNCPHFKMYLSLVKNVFVQIAKCICPNCKICLSECVILSIEYSESLSLTAD